jgi:hypothetical protein
MCRYAIPPPNVTEKAMSLEGGLLLTNFLCYSLAEDVVIPSNWQMALLIRQRRHIHTFFYRRLPIPGRWRYLTKENDMHIRVLSSRGHKLSKNLRATLNPSCRNGDVNQVPFWGPTNSLLEANVQNLFAGTWTIPLLFLREAQCLTRGFSRHMFSAYTYFHLEDNLSSTFIGHFPTHINQDRSWLYTPGQTTRNQRGHAH